VLSDVTEEERIEKERREFVSNVSHELRTPLTTLRSYLEALTDGAWKDEEIRSEEHTSELQSRFDLVCRLLLEKKKKKKKRKKDKQKLKQDQEKKEKKISIDETKEQTQQKNKIRKHNKEKTKKQKKNTKTRAQ